MSLVRIGGTGGVFASSYDPSNITALKVWFDGMEAASVTKDGSNVVSAWASRAGSLSSYTLSQATAGLQPTYDPADGTIVLTGTAPQFLKNETTPVLSAGQPYTIAMLMKIVTPAQYGYILTLMGADANHTPIMFWNNGDAGYDKFLIADASAGARSHPYPSDDITNDFWAAIIYTSTTDAVSTATRVININGAVVASPIIAGGDYEGFYGTVLNHYKGTGGGSASPTMRWAELIVTQAVMSPTEIQNLINYWAAKRTLNIGQT